MSELRARAWKTVSQLLELSKGQVDANDILALGMFFGELGKGDESIQALQEALDDHHQSEKDRGNLTDRGSSACSALLRLQDAAQLKHLRDDTAITWNVISELKSIVDHYESVVRFTLNHVNENS